MASGDFNKDGLQDVLLGAPGTIDEAKGRGLVGLVYLVYGSKNVTGHNVLELSSNPNVFTFSGAFLDANSRFGAAVLALDFNLE